MTGNKCSGFCLMLLQVVVWTRFVLLNLCVRVCFAYHGTWMPPGGTKSKGPVTPCGPSTSAGQPNLCKAPQSFMRSGWRGMVFEACGREIGKEEREGHRERGRDGERESRRDRERDRLECRLSSCAKRKKEREREGEVDR